MGSGDARRYLATSTAVDLAGFMQRHERGDGPGHGMVDLAAALGAQVVQPDSASVRWMDRLASKLVASPSHWATARALVARLGPGDLVYATGEDCGLPIAAMNALRRRRGAVAVHVLAPWRPRVRVLTWLLSRVGPPLMLATGTSSKAEQLRRLVPTGRAPVYVADEQTDTSYFSPATRRQARERPLVVSSGLEQRDFVTLASAVADLDVDVKICAASPNFTDRTTVAIPDELPPNVEMRRFEFPELLELYQQADVTVLSLLPNEYAAGSTALLEAVACGSPVVMTTGVGTPKEFIDDDLIVGVAPQEPDLLRAAIVDILESPDEAADRAARALERVNANHSKDGYVRDLASALVEFERASKGAGPPGSS